MIDHLVKGALVVDGSGLPAYRGDIGIDGDRIVTVDDRGVDARNVIDADGLVLTPGFVDVHTHYDAQLLWDPTASPSLAHGTTTVIGGNCGYSIAPLAPDDDYVQRMMARVEGIPIEALTAGPPWTWTSFAGWLDAVDGRTALNVAFLVGHSAVRRSVMGAEASETAASEDQILSMERLVREAIEVGAIGFSTSRGASHVDGDGAPVPSRLASDEELLRLAAVAGAYDGTSLQTIPDNIISMSESEAELMIEMSVVAQRPINWNLLKISSRDPSAHQRQLTVSDRAAARGGRVVALTLPQVNRLYVSLENGFLFDSIPEWKPVLRLALRERMQALADPTVRDRLRAGARSAAGSLEAGVVGVLADLACLEVVETSLGADRRLLGRTVGQIAAGRDPLDTLVDLALEEDLRTGFSVPPPDDDDASWRMRAELWQDPRTVVGGSDAGAHLDLMCGGSYTTTMLGDAVRQRGLIGLEAAVREMSAVPAALYGLRNRGRIAPGWFADLVLLDPDTVGAGEVETRSDMPGGARRLMRASLGIERVWVNGVLAVEDGVSVRRESGRLLRSGRDTAGTGVSP